MWILRLRLRMTRLKQTPCGLLVILSEVFTNQSVDFCAQNDKTLPLPCAFSFDKKAECFWRCLVRSAFKKRCAVSLVILSEAKYPFAWISALKMTFGRLSLGSLCRKPLVKSRNWWFVSKCRSKNSALAKNLRKLRLNLQDFERILGENMAWKWAFEVLKNGYLRWVRACENLGLEKRDTKIFKGWIFKGVKFCDLAKWDFEKSAALYVGVDFFKGWI